MSIADMLRWLLITAGCIYLVTESVILSSLRVAIARKSHTLMTLLYCRACFGFWAGLGTGLLGLWPFGHTTPIEPALAAMALGAVWSHWVPNHAWLAEYAEDNIDDDATKESQDG